MVSEKSCNSWKLSPYRHPTKNIDIEKNSKAFKSLLKACKSSSLKSEDCSFFDETSINPLTGYEVSKSGNKYASLKKKCSKLNTTSVCDEWLLEREKKSPKNPKTNRKVSSGGKVFLALDKECNSESKKSSTKKSKTKSICDEWLLEREKKSPKNPKTNRKVSPGGKVFLDLDKECGISSKKSKPASIKKSNKKSKPASIKKSSKESKPASIKKLSEEIEIKPVSIKKSKPASIKKLNKEIKLPSTKLPSTKLPSMKLPSIKEIEIKPASIKNTSPKLESLKSKRNVSQSPAKPKKRISISKSKANGLVSRDK